MNLQLEYMLGADEQLAHESFKGGYAVLKPDYFKQVAPHLALSGLGLVASFRAQSVSLLAVFALVAGVCVVDAARKSLTWKRKLAVALAEAPRTEVRLVVDDRGLEETVEKLVVSFAPWAAVKSYVCLETIWAFNLAGGHVAMVPSSAIAGAGPDAAAELKAELKARSIPQLVRDRVPGRG